MAVRAAIGASQRRLVQQLLVESLLLAAAGGLAGLLVGAAGVRAIHALGAGTVPRLEAVGLDPGVLAFTALVTLAAGLLSGLAPAWRSSRLDLTQHLKTEGRGASGTGALWRRGHGLRRLLVAGEIALAVVLLVGAVLVVRSVARLASVTPGFDPSGTLTFEVTMQGPRYEKGIDAHRAYRDLWQRIEALPGVTAAGAVSALPLSQHFAWGPLTVEGRTRAPGEAFINADMRFVEGRYFEAMRIPLVDGRLFTPADSPPAPQVALVDTQMAAQLWPGQSAVGKRFQIGVGDDPKAPWITVVGVVGRVKQYTLDADSRIALYMPHAHIPARAMSVVIRSDADPVALTAAARQALHAVDPNLPLFRVATKDARVGESLARRRFLMVLLTLFAGVACSLAMVGCYGVLAYVVSQGTRDLAIRMALGATRRDVVRLVVGHGLAIAGAGIVAGLVAAAAATRVLESLLFEVRARDPWTFAAVAAGTAAVAALAALTPAWRATRIDPVRALSID
jgi:predicted permease